MPSIYRRSGKVSISAFATILVLFIVSLIITVFATYAIWRLVRGPTTVEAPPNTSTMAIPAPSPFSYLDQRPLATPNLIHTPSNPFKTTLQPSGPRRPPSPPRSRPNPTQPRSNPPQPRPTKPQPRPNPPPTNPKSRPPTPPLRNPSRPLPLPTISAPAGTGSTGLAHRQLSTADELAMATYIRSLSPEQLNATARGDSTFFSGSSIAAGSSSIAGSEMSSLPTNAAFAAEFARREMRLRERGLKGRGWALVESEGGSVGVGEMGDGGAVVPRPLDVRKGGGRRSLKNGRGESDEEL